MNKTVVFLCVISIFGCDMVAKKMYLNNSTSYSVNFFGETWDKEFVIQFDSLGRKSAEGNYGMTRNGEVGDFKVGKWIEYYSSNGQIKSIGNYKIGSFLFCSTRPRMRCYNYKDGYWEYYFGDGTIKARGKYELIESNIQNNCSGGVMIEFGVISEKWDLNLEIKDSMKSWDCLKEFQSVPQGIDPLYPNIGVDSENKIIIH